ncbi:MAG: transposase [Verrucomicrobia bacterium]|nr:transposase [Verrucomicrobiota bacterium]MCH8510712.1 transposase [Kiritimatiellia bacterium]
MTSPSKSSINPYAYQLRYGWNAWPGEDTRFPPRPSSLQEIVDLWETDGLRPLEWVWTPEGIQILFSTVPGVAPVELAQRAKGRLQHLLRKNGTPATFSRKVSAASVGNAHEQGVDNYLQQQLQGADFADPRYRDALAELAFQTSDFSLCDPIFTHSGRYVYALHVVFVTAERWRMPLKTATIVQKAFLNMSESSTWKIGKLSMMPDHVHLAIRGDPQWNPQAIVEALREATCTAAGTRGFWMPGAYMGTFGPYGMGAIRAKVRNEDSP